MPKSSWWMDQVKTCKDLDSAGRSLIQNLKTRETSLAMNLAGGKKISELSEGIEVTAVSSTDEDVQKIFQVYTVQKPCSGAKTLSCKAIESYLHLKSLSKKLHNSRGSADLLIGTNLVGAFVRCSHSVWRSRRPCCKKELFRLVPLRSS